MLTTDPKHPKLTHGIDTKKTPQAEVYLILSEEERAKGYLRPFRNKYIHKGERPTYPIRDLTKKEQETYKESGYTKYEKYPKGDSIVGRFWTDKQLNSGCEVETKMGDALSETYARNPKFYGATYCVGCQMHLPVAEFVWSSDGEVVGS